MNFKKIKSLLFLIFRVSLSFGILFYLFKKTDFSQLKILFAQIDLNYYFLALFCVIIFQSLVALRWKKICSAWGFEEKFFFYLKSYLMGFSLNTLFPGVVAGDTLRGFNLYKRGFEWKKTSLSVVLDRVFGLMGIMFILTFSLRGGANFLPDKFRILLQFIVYSSIFAFVGIVLFLTFFSKTTFLNPLKLPYVIIPLVLGIIIQIFFVFQFLFLGKALNLPLRFSFYFTIIPIVSFLSALPLSISGLGLREGTLSYFLHLMNYPLEYGLSLGLLAYSLILISAIPGIILYLRGKWN
ncbi:MAG: lysylphosphatidylglycerol synthase transmembrane domain-containing protein [Caldimicrobium sp.]